MQVLEKNILKHVNIMDLDQFSSINRDLLFKNLRETMPVCWHPVDTGGFWILSKYKDILQAWKNTAELSSEHGIMLRLHNKKDPAAGKMMVVTDPPRHAQLRKLHVQALKKRTVKSFEDKIRQYVCYLLDSVESCSSFDFSEEVAAKLPVGITCELLGIDVNDWGLIAQLTKTSAAAEDEEFSKDSSIQEAIISTNNEIFSYFFRQINYRRDNLSDDMISHLINTTIDGIHLTNEEIAMNCFSLLIGGNETTKYASVGGLYAFICNPEEWQYLKKNSNGISLAIEEVLRWTTPVMHSMRIAKCDTHIGGTFISEGEIITLWNNSANRDSEIFRAPEVFDVKRSPNRHISFGWGPHNCLGASIARLELSILFREMANRNYDFKLISDPLFVRSNVLNGVKHLNIAIS